MAFAQVTKMDQRRALAVQAIVCGWSVSQCAREFGVSRKTAHLWIERAKAEGVAGLAERSRRPHASPAQLDEALVRMLLDEKARYPAWGAKKLLARLWPPGQAPFSLRTANRVLSRHGLACRPPEAPPATCRFERASANELWQMDFKGLKFPRVPYEALSILDDASRFCVGLIAVADQSFLSVWDALWNLFGEYGLPEAILCDNGPAFGSSRLPSHLAVNLMKLRVRLAHGRPYHPQTQGKVERFHGTMARELGPALRPPTREEAQAAYRAFRDTYNWERPHEALAMAVPGSAYRSSSRLRPLILPSHDIEPHALKRKVDDWGNLGFKSQRYKVGRGLAGEYVVLQEDERGFNVLFCAHILGRLEDFRV